MCSRYLGSRAQWLTKSFCAVGSYVLILGLSFQAYAGLPPTTSTVIGDTSDVTTFHFDFPNFTGTHTSTRLSLGVNSIAGGGTGQTTANSALNALLPSQTSNTGKFLQTDGTDSSWAPVFTLPSFTAGSVIFSDGTTLAEDNANFFWDDTNNRLDLGNPPFPSSDLTARLRNYWISTDPTNNLLVNNFNSINYTITEDSATNLLNNESQIVYAVAAGKSNFAFTANHYSLIGRGDGGDEGYVGFTANYLGSLTHGGSALKHTGIYAAFMHAFDSIGSDGLIDNMYDFYAQGGSPGAGAITNRYGIVIEPDSGYIKTNWLSGRTLIGGSSFSAPTESLVIQGATSGNNPLGDDIEGFGGQFQVSTHTTIDGSVSTNGLQSSATALVDAGITNSKSAIGTLNTVTRGDGSDSGTLSAMLGTENLMEINSDAAGTTSFIVGFLNFVKTDSGNIDDLYDFRSIRVPGAGVLTNHWGVYIDNDSTTSVKNFLSGQTKLGGSGFTTTADALYVEGDYTMTGFIHSTDTNESIDPNGRHLIKNGYNVVDWDSDKLTDDSGNDSVDWKNRILKDSGTNAVLNYSASDAIELKVHLKSTGTAPSATPDANAGTSATCTVSQATDMAGTVQLVTGSVGWAAGAQCAITFAIPYGIAPKCQLTPGNSNAALAALNFYATKTVSDLTLNFINPDLVATTYEWDYSCVETQ